jgi:hypothetical protein
MYVPLNKIKQRTWESLQERFVARGTICYYNISDEKTSILVFHRIWNTRGMESTCLQTECIWCFVLGFWLRIPAKYAPISQFSLIGAPQCTLRGPKYTYVPIMSFFSRYVRHIHSPAHIMKLHKVAYQVGPWALPYPRDMQISNMNKCAQNTEQAVFFITLLIWGGTTTQSFTTQT